RLSRPLPGAGQSDLPCPGQIILDWSFFKVNRREFMGVGSAAPLLSAQVQTAGKPRSVSAAGTWSLENGRIRRVLAPGDRSALHLRELRNARTGFNWAAGDPADIFLSAGSEHSIGFAPSARFRVVSHENRIRDDGAAELKL